MIRTNPPKNRRTSIRESIDGYLSGRMDAELTHFLGKNRNERHHGDINHCNDTYEQRAHSLHSPNFYQYKNGTALGVKPTLKVRNNLPFLKELAFIILHY